MVVFIAVGRKDLFLSLMYFCYYNLEYYTLAHFSWICFGNFAQCNLNILYMCTKNQRPSHSHFRIYANSLVPHTCMLASLHLIHSDSTFRWKFPLCITHITYYIQESYVPCNKMYIAVNGMLSRRCYSMIIVLQRVGKHNTFWAHGIYKDSEKVVQKWV